MLHFLESSVLGMWNDAVLPPLSSSLVNSSFGDAETWQQASNPSVEIERINCGSFFGSTLQEDYSDFLQRHFFSSALDSSAEFITGNNGDPMMAKVAAALQPKAVVGERRKRKKQQSPSYQSKRLKKTACSSHKQHHVPRNESETLAGRPLGKVPLRRSQKLGDKITALQQLVSPFGKTDTASVLQEAALSIKFLHEQIRALIAPYFAMRIPEERLQVHSENSSYSTADLRRKGLCLLPTYTITGLMDQPACDHHGYQLPETTMARENGLHFYQRVSN